MEDIFMGYRVTAHCRPTVHREHNNRTPEIVDAEKHIDKTRLHQNILDLGSLEEVYKQVFQAAQEKYNANQNRSKRKITNYLNSFLADKRHGKHRNKKADGSRKPVYEFIFQIGNRDCKCNEEQAIKVLTLFVQKILPRTFPNIKPIGIYLHNDEFSIDENTGSKVYSPPHIHFDYIPIAHSLTTEEIQVETEYRKEQEKLKRNECKLSGTVFDEKKWKKINWQTSLVSRYGKSLCTGMEIQSSLTGALCELGFVTSKGKGTAQQQFEESVRHSLEDFAEGLGIPVDRTKGSKHSHSEKDVFQQKKENERKQEELNKQLSIITSQSNEISSKKETLIELKKQVEEETKKLQKTKEEVETQKCWIEKNQQKAQAIAVIYKEVEEKKLSFDEEYEKLNAPNKISLKDKVSTFTQNVRKIIIHISTELTSYKKAFSKFWHAKAEDFRNLADYMDKENCHDFEAYHKFQLHKESLKEAKKTNQRLQKISSHLQSNELEQSR